MRLLLGFALAWFTLVTHAEDFGVFTTSELRVVIGNNAEAGNHQAGYNGIVELTSIHEPESLFVPAYAGLNFEHIFHDRMNLADRKEFFEPRNAPMTFALLDDHTAVLRQAATPVTGIESQTTFRVQEPNCIDVEFTMTPTKRFSESGTFGFFWASYINAPLDKSMYMLHAGSSLQVPRWFQFCTQHHNHHSTVEHEHATTDWRFPDEWLGETLFTSFSPMTYSEPFFYGRFRDMVWIVMFEDAEGIRLAHSPSGGGNSPDGDDTNPAWDFQWIVPSFEVGESRTIRYRMVYKPWGNRADVIHDVMRYRVETDSR